MIIELMSFVIAFTVAFIIVGSVGLYCQARLSMIKNKRR